MIFLVLTIIAIIACSPIEPYRPESESNTGGYNSPKAMFSFSKINPLTIQLYNNSQNADSYQWDFGDGTTSKEKDPIHKYKNKGVYKIVLKATKNNKFATEEKTVQIEKPTKIYVAGMSYDKLELQNEYFRMTLTDDDFFTTTWVTSDWKLLSNANLPHRMNAKVILDDMASDEWYKLTIYYNSSKSGKGKEYISGKITTKEILTNYPDKYTWTDKDKKNQFSIYFMYE